MKKLAVTPSYYIYNSPDPWKTLLWVPHTISPIRTGLQLEQCSETTGGVDMRTIPFAASGDICQNTVESMTFEIDVIQ